MEGDERFISLTELSSPVLLGNKVEWYQLILLKSPPSRPERLMDV